MLHSVYSYMIHSYLCVCMHVWVLCVCTCVVSVWGWYVCMCRRVAALLCAKYHFGSSHHLFSSQLLCLLLTIIII